MSNDSNRQDKDNIGTGISSSSNDLFYTREMSDILYFIEENEENDNYYTQQDLSNNSLNNSLSNNSLNNFLLNNSLNNSLSDNSLLEIMANSIDLRRVNYEAKCNWCKEKWSRRQSKDMKIYLTRNCEYIFDEIKTYWRKVLLEETSNIHPQNAKQPQITKHFDHITPIPITKSNKIDQALLKAWVCCGFPFQTIENPFIINLFRIAIPGYTLFSRDILSGKLLDQETIQIEKKIENDLEYSNHLTIS
ncbi:4842_t:CDS:2, partial [Diversispora eburnea]